MWQGCYIKQANYGLTKIEAYYSLVKNKSGLRELQGGMGSSVFHISL